MQPAESIDTIKGDANLEDSLMTLLRCLLEMRKPFAQGLLCRIRASELTIRRAYIYHHQVSVLNRTDGFRNAFVAPLRNFYVSLDIASYGNGEKTEQMQETKGGSRDT